MNVYSRIRAVIFDVDNTLLATDAYAQETILQTLAALQGEGKQIHVPSPEQFHEVFRQNLPFEEIFHVLFASQWEMVLLYYRQIAKNKPYTATPHAVEIVQSLIRSGVIVGLVTNRARMLDERLEQIGLKVSDMHFVHQPQADHERKPHPKSLDRAVQQLLACNISRNEILVVGDHPDDMQAAWAHGMDFMAVLQGSATREDFLARGLDTHSMIQDLGELETAFSKRTVTKTYRASLTNVSALDGRHARTSQQLASSFSEFALHKHRVIVEVMHLICLDETFPEQIIPRRLTKEEHQMLEAVIALLSNPEEAFAIMEYDHLGRNGIGPTEHDVKSCELWLREKLAHTSLEDMIPFIHIFLTSEDVNNLAYKMMMADAVNKVFVPHTYAITDRLAELTEAYACVPVMGRTHLQPASPTTFGKIFATYLMRLTKGLERLKEIRLTGKLNGAVGNYNSFTAACPELDWMHYSRTIVNRVGFDVEYFTDQRGPHTDMIRAFQAIQEINNVLRDLATDLSLYAAFGTMYFSKVESHVGSSTMPHKVNPWFAEVAESNGKKANALINLFTSELDVSRLQRDLSDHDYERSYGEAMGYVLVAMEHLEIALQLIRPDAASAMKELEAHPEVVTEAIQTVLRHAGNPDAYDQLKTLSRGTHPSFGDIRNFVLTLGLKPEVQDRLLNLMQPGHYTGLAARLAKDGLDQYRHTRAQWDLIPFRFLTKN